MNFVCLVLQVYWFIVILRIILRMVIEFGRIPWGHPVRQISDLLGKLVDPVLNPLRRFIPALPMGGMSLDLSPLVLLFGLVILMNIICG